MICFGIRVSQYVSDKADSAGKSQNHIKLLRLSVCLFVCLFVRSFAKNSKTTPDMNLKSFVCFIYDNEIQIHYLFSLYGHLTISFFSSHCSTTNVTLANQARQGNILHRDSTQAN